MNWDFLVVHFNYLDIALLIGINISFTLYYHSSTKRDPDIALLIGISDSHAFT